MPQRPAARTLRWLLFLSCLVSVWIFSDIGEDWNDPGWSDLEYRIASPFLHHRTEAATRFFTTLSWLGSNWALFAWTALFTLSPRPARTRLDKASLVAFALSATAVNLLLKAFFSRPRPADQFTPLVHEGSFSFPSGHSMLSLCVYGFTAYLAARTWPQSRLTIAGAAVSLVLAIGCSRIYLAAHYPGDVIGAFAAGWPCLCAAVALHSRLRRPAQAS